MERISWDQYFMAQSHLLALRSTCERLMVGATIVRDNRIIAGGYNGSVSGSIHCIDEGCYVIDGHCARTIHAEMNGIIQCAKFGVPTENATIYVTHYPCLQCCKSIIQAGIKKVIYAEPYKNHPYAEQLFKEAGVKVEQVELTYLNVDTKAKDKILFLMEIFQKMESHGVNREEIQLLRNRADSLFTTLD